MNIDKLKREAKKAIKIEEELKLQEEQEKNRDIYSKLSTRSLLIILAYFNCEEDPIPITAITDEEIQKIPVYGSMEINELEEFRLHKPSYVAI